MRLITAHQIDESNRGLEIEVIEPPDANGSTRKYIIVGDGGFRCSLNFAGGDPFLPGLTNEALLAVIIDRLDSFQGGPHACAENATALNALRVASAALTQRAQRVAPPTLSDVVKSVVAEVAEETKPDA